jgi:hypothetical protein
MPQARNLFRDHISKALHAQYDETMSEPLPQRWVDLIHYLNERERMPPDECPQPRSEPNKGHPTRHSWREG